VSANAVGGWFSLNRLGKGVGSGMLGMDAVVAGVGLAATGVVATAEVLEVMFLGTPVDVFTLELGAPAIVVATEMMGTKLSDITVGETKLEASIIEEDWNTD